MGQVVGVVVPGTVVEMCDRQAGLDLKAAYDATDEWIMLPRDAASFSLISRKNRQDRIIVWHVSGVL
jgi:hypothetical protein